MAADNQTTLTINIDTLLRGLEKTLRGLKQVEAQLKRTAGVTAGTQTAANINRTAAATQRLQQQQQRAAISAQRLSQQQQALGIRTQQLANAQLRADQTTRRLGLAQQRLNEQTSRTTQTLGAQADKHVQAFRAIERASRQATQNILSVGNALRSVGQGLASLGATLSVTITAPLAAVGAASVDAAVRMDSLKRGLTAIVGSSDEANRQLARLTQIAKLPGIGFEEAIQGSIRLQAVGFSAAEAEKSLREFANAVALTGGGRDELNRVTIQLGQLAAKGKVLSQDLRPIIESAPAVGRALLQAFGTVNADDIQELGLTTRQFLGTLTEELSRLPRAAAGAKNSFENFRDEVFRAAAAVGEALLPGLIRLVEVVGPVITKLADTFARLPGPVQVVVVGVGALLAALGPVVFVVGQLTLGVGRLLVGFVELNAAGIVPSIASMRAYAASALSAAAANKTLGVSTVGLGAGLGLLVSALAAVVVSYQLYNAFQKDAATLSKEQAEALTAEIDGLEKQAQFLGALKIGVERTADEQQRLLEIYDKLNLTAQTRITGITDEEKRLLALRVELEKLIQLRQQERVQAAATLAGTLANTLANVAANDAERDSITARVQANTQLIEILQREDRISGESNRALAERGLLARTVEEAVGALQSESENLVQQQKALRDSVTELNGTAKEQADTLAVLQRQTGLTARELLLAAKNMGVFKGDVEQTLAILQRYVEQADAATKATDAFSRALAQQSSEALRAGDAADALAKSRKALIEANAATAREAADSFAGALKDMQAFIDAQPQLRQAIAREAQISGKSFNAVVDDALQKAFGQRKDKSATALRNAQEQLAKTLAEVAQASAEQQGVIEKAKNDALLRENENAFRLNLRSLQLYLSQRALLLKANLQLEIDEQRKLVDAAIAEQQRFLARAGKVGLPPAERTKAEAGAKAAEEKAIKAQTKILELTARQRQVDDEATQERAEHARQQEADLRQLQVEYGKLRGRIEDALNAATDEKFRDVLQQLALDQETLNKRISAATKNRQADELAELQLARDRNQAQVEAIQGIITQERALNRLSAAEELVRRAREQQSQLESDLTFQVEFRGLAEEEAIRRRLEGERKLADSLRLSRDIVNDTVTALQAQGVKPPQALVEFVRDLGVQLRGLGELSFGEQFRLAEKEFTRLNDLRLQKIADVERAVRNRDIAEAEGLLLIRRINGDYVGDLERQVELLKQIAAASGDAQLQRQAADAAETAKDAADELASLDKQIRATAIDGLRDGFTQFFLDVTDGAKSAQDILFSFIDNVVGRVNQVIAENLGRELVESLFGGDTVASSGGGILAGIKRVFGLGGGGEGATGGLGVAAGAAQGATLQTAATTAAATLQAGATAAAATDTASAVSFATAITAAATGFASAVAAAGAAFAAAVTAAAGAQSVAGGIGSGIGSFATGDILPARPGGRLVQVAEGGHAEAVLTTDPKHALKQARLLTRFLRMTRGLQGRFPVPRLAEGALVSPREAEANLLTGITRTTLNTAAVSDLALAGAGSSGPGRLRLVLTDERSVGDWLNSSEGERVMQMNLVKNRPLIRDLAK